MLLIAAHSLAILGLYFFAFGLKIPIPPETSRKKVALHALWPTFGGLLLIGVAGCNLYGALFEGKDWFS